MLRCRPIERCRQRENDRVVSFVRRSFLPDRRHLARPQFPDDPFPRLRMLRNLRAADGLQIQPALFTRGIVTIRAITGYKALKGRRITVCRSKAIQSQVGDQRKNEGASGGRKLCRLNAASTDGIWPLHNEKQHAGLDRLKQGE